MQWIDINKKVPKNNQYVITYSSGFTSTEQSIGIGCYKSCCKKDFVFINSHWMPLPLPPTVVQQQLFGFTKATPKCKNHYNIERIKKEFGWNYCPICGQRF